MKNERTAEAFYYTNSSKNIEYIKFISKKYGEVHMEIIGDEISVTHNIIDSNECGTITYHISSDDAEKFATSFKCLIKEIKEIKRNKRKIK